MLRVAFIVSLLLAFSAFALRGPLEALVLYLWLAYFRPETWAWTPFFRTVPLSSVAGVYLLLRVGLSTTRFRFDLRTFLLLCFLSLALISGLNSRWFDRSTGMFMDVSKAFLVTYLLALLTDSASKLRIVLQTIALSLGFESAKQAWVQLLTSPGSQNDNPIVFLGDNNGVAVGMLMLVPMFIVLGRTTAWKPERWFYWFMAIGVLYRGLTTYSRGGFLAAIAMGLIYVIRSPKRVPAFAGAAVAAVVIMLALPQAYWDRMSTVGGIETQEGNVVYDESAAGRLYFWKVAIQMANDNLIGVGPGSFQEAYPTYDETDGRFGEKRAVHSAWFGTVAELGYGGLFVMLSAIALAWLATARAQSLANRDQVPKELGHIGAGLEASLIAYIVGASFLNMQYVEMFWHLIGLTMGLNWALQESLQAQSSPLGQPGQRVPMLRPNIGTVRRAS